MIIEVTRYLLAGSDSFKQKILEEKNPDICAASVEALQLEMDGIYIACAAG